MISGRQIPMETATMENLFLQIFERKRRIVEQVKHQINLYDQQLASKCILDGVTPPEWLWSPSFPSQTSELNKEEIISGLLFSHSRPSNIYSSSRGLSYQQPVSFLVDNVKTFKLNQPLEEQFLEEDQQHDLSHNNLEDAGCVPSSAHEQDNIASTRDFQEEIIPTSASTCFEQNVSCLIPEYSQNNKVGKSAVATSLDGTSPGYIREEMVPEGVSTTGCEPKIRCTSPRCCPDEAEQGISLDPTLSLAKIQRSKSRQRALELRSSAKASKSRSKSIKNLQASPAENLGYEIASFRSESVSDIGLFEHNENAEEGCQEEAVENNKSQDKERDQVIKFSTTPKSTSTSEKVDSVRKSNHVDKYASVAPDSRDPKSVYESGIVDERASSLHTNTANELSTKEEGKVIDSQRKTCSEIIHLDKASRSKSLANGFSFKNEKTKLRNSCSGELRSRSLHASPRADQEIELPQFTTIKNEACMQIEAGMSSSQSQNVYSGRVTRSRSAAQGCRSKTECLGNADFSSVDLQSRHSVALLQCDDERKLLKPTTVCGEGLLVEDNTDDEQCKEKGESIVTSISSRSNSLGQVDVLVDESTEVGQIQGCKSKAEYLGQLELSSVELHSRHSVAVLQSGEERELLKPPTVSEKGLLVQEDYAGDKLCKEKDESIHPSRISTFRSLGQAEISVGEFVLQENGVVPGDLVEHSTSNCGSKVAHPHSSWTKPESSQHGKISRLRSSSIQEELATKHSAPSVSAEHGLVAKQLDLGLVNSLSNSPHGLPASVKLEPLHFNDNKEKNFNEMLLNYREEFVKGDCPIPPAVTIEINASSPTVPEVNLLVYSNLSAIVKHDGREKEQIPARESPIGDADLEAGESEHAEANTRSSINSISNVCVDASKNSLKSRLNPSIPNNSSDNLAQPQAPEKSSLCEMSKELLSIKESKFSFEEDIYQLDVLKHALSTSYKRSQEQTIAEHRDEEMKADPSVGEWNQSGNSYISSDEPEKYSAALGGGFSDDSLQQQTEQPLHQVQTSFGKGCCPHTGQNIACTESRVIQAPESSIRALRQSSPFTESSHMQSKRRRTLEKLAHGMPSSASPLDDPFDSGSVGGKLGTVHHSVECLSLSHYDVELQKMIGSASSTELRLDEGYLLKEAGFMSPAALTFKAEQLGELGSQTIPNHGIGSEYTDIVPSAQETPHLLASRVSNDSIGLLGSNDGSLPVLEGFIIQTDDEDQSGSHGQINLDGLRLPETTVERASVLEQIFRPAFMSTSALHLSTSFKFDGKPKLNQSVPNRLLESMLVSSGLQTKDDESKKLEEGGSVFVNWEIDHAFHGRSRSDCLPLSGAGSSAETRSICASPTGKLWYRSMPKSASSEKRGTLSPDLPCIAEENENMDEATEKLWSGNTPKSASSEKRGSSSLDLPCIAEENENADESFEAVCEYSKVNNASAERKPLLVVDENIEFPEAKMRVDRQSLESVNTAFSFTSTCNSVKSKLGKQKGGTRRSTVKGKENKGISRGAARKIDPLNNRSSKPKLSGNSSLTIQGPRLSEKEPMHHNNIVSNITSFIPLVQQPKPASELITGKRDVKVKALEAAEAAKRLAEKKENERKMKKEALKLERARQEQENQKKQELEKQKKEERKRKEAEMAERKRQKDEEEKKLKEEERKKKEAEIAERKRQREEEERKLKEEERKRKEAEMAERKRQREEEDKKLKEPKRKRMAGAHKLQHQREPEAKLLAEKGEKESRTQAMEALVNAMKTAQERANSRLPSSTVSDISEDSKSMSSVGDISKVITDLGKASDETSWAAETIEESYDISPYKCSDDEDEDEDDEDGDVRNTKFVPAWASKSCVLQAVSSQQSVDPEKIFPPKSFCSMEEVLLPRRLQSR